jgi:hypothetical protein
MRDSASATPSLHPAYLINKLNNYVKELNIILPNGTNIGGLWAHYFSYPSTVGRYWPHRFLLLPSWETLAILLLTPPHLGRPEGANNRRSNELLTKYPNYLPPKLPLLSAP